VAVGVRATNWKENRYENICYVHDMETGAAHPLNRTGSVSQVEWLDDDSLAVLKQGPGDDDKAQVWLYEGLVGEGWQITEHKTGVEWFKPFAGGFLFRARNPERDERKPRSSRFGKFTHFEQEDSTSALYYCGLEERRRYEADVKAATEDEAKEIGGAALDPAGRPLSARGRHIRELLAAGRPGLLPRYHDVPN
jgi:hypothetical protein